MSKVWFSGWTISRSHKVLYQTAVSLGAAVACVAAMELIGVPENAKRWLAIPVAVIVASIASFLIHSYLWKEYTPYITKEQAHLLHSEQALPAPAIARVWLGGAMFLTLVCVYAILIDVWHGGPIWRLGAVPVGWWFSAPLYSIAFSFQRPLNKVLPSG